LYFTFGKPICIVIRHVHKTILATADREGVERSTHCLALRGAAQRENHPCGKSWRGPFSIHQLRDSARLLKIGADLFPSLKILATGSSTLAASNKFSDSLTGRQTHGPPAAGVLGGATGLRCSCPLHPSQSDQGEHHQDDCRTRTLSLARPRRHHGQKDVDWMDTAHVLVRR